jgi:hypothetical protein
MRRDAALVATLVGPTGIAVAVAVAVAAGVSTVRPVTAATTGRRGWSVAATRGRSVRGRDGLRFLTLDREPQRLPALTGPLQQVFGDLGHTSVLLHVA